MELSEAHPEGVTFVGDTIPHFLTRANLASFLEFEKWFHALRPFRFRALCPYDLTRLPIDKASEALGTLADHHSHMVFSEDPNPGVRLLQLLLVPRVENPPPAQRSYLKRAIAHRLLETNDAGKPVALSLRGEQLIRGLGWGSLRRRPRSADVDPSTG